MTDDECFVTLKKYGNILNMDTTIENFNNIKEKTKKLYDSQEKNFNPFFQSNITFNSDGFHHLQFSARRERNKKRTNPQI